MGSGWPLGEHGAAYLRSNPFSAGLARTGRSIMNSENILEIGAEQFEFEVLRSQIPVVVDFYSTECAP